jgi:PKD repeat protein
MVKDPDGASSDWMELSDALVVMNSEPVINSARAVRTRMLRNESCAVTVTGEDYETPRTELSVEFRVRDPRGKEQPGFITKARWVNGSWEATFSPSMAAAPGKYNLSARLGDADGGWSSWKDMPSAVEVGNNMPVAGFTAPQSAVQGSMVSFDGAGSSDIEDQANLLTFGWSFGDGSAPGIGRLATHSFARAGTFKVTLTVTDRDGSTATAQRTVSVTESPAAPITAGGTISWLAIGLIVIVVAAAAGGYLFMQKRKAPGGAGPPQAASAQVAAPQAAVQYVPLHPQTGQENGAMHGNMEQCRQTHGEQRRAAQQAEEPSRQGTFQARPYQAGAYQAGAYNAGPSPGPYPMPGPGPDPLRPTEPEPGPGPYPEPDDDDDDD